MDWRNNLDSMQKRMLAAMKNHIPDLPHDVAFVVGDDKKKISCHKIFLIMLSPVFEVMFSSRHSTLETPITGMEIVSNDPPCEYKSIIIPDVHPAGFKNIIKYAYTGVMSVDLKDVVATMYASHKYDIPELTQYCSKLLHSILHVENVVTIYQASTILNEVKLSENAWKFIECNGGALLNSKEFIEFSEENLLKFLSLNDIPKLKSEADVFNAVLRWGNSQWVYGGLDLTKENLRTILKKCISLIRFPTMNVDEFNEIVLPSGILKSKECIQLFIYYTTTGVKRVSIGKKLPYSSESRTDYGKFVFCNAVITDKLEIYNGFNSMDQFTINGITGVIKLKSVGIVLPVNFTRGTAKSVSVGLYDPSLSQWTHTATKMVSKPLEICYIEFENSVSLKSNVDYGLHVNYANGSYATNPVEVVKYSSSLMSQSTVTLITANIQQFTIKLIPHCQVIWALKFED